jgi:uncharacterized protein (TIGR03086 family)
MSEVSDRYNTVADGFAERLEGMTESSWAAPTPCTQWTARDLVVHVVRTQRQVRSSLGDVESEEVDPDGDLVAEFRSARTSVTDALRDPDKASQTISGMFGEQPFESLVGRLLCADTLVHTWDLARATGQDEQLDPAAVAAAGAFLEPIDDAIRRPGGFAAKITPPAGADEQKAFLNFCGRDG